HVIGQPITRTDGVEKATGKARYTADVLLPGTLWGKALRSPLPYARIIRIDTAQARALPGVRAVLTGADVPGVLYGKSYRDATVLAQERVRFIGEQVAAVAAVDEETAQRAVDLILVEYEELPAVLDPLGALREDAPILHPEVNSYAGLPRLLEKPSNAFSREVREKGDVEKGFAQADLVVENTFTMARVHQGYLEPHSCLVWIDPQDRVQVWAANKAPHSLKEGLAVALGIPKERVRVNPVVIGGDFGGKGAIWDEPLCYFLALRTGRPVMMVMDYADEFTAAAPRHAGIIRWKTGVNRDGTLVAQQMEAIFDSGAYGGFRPRAPMDGAFSTIEPYRVPHFHMESIRVYTNNIPGGQMRASGGPQCRFAAESQIDCVARRLGMDPLEFRLKNLINDGEKTAMGVSYREIKAVETLQKGVAAAEYRAPKPANVGRGIAMHQRAPGGGESVVVVTLNPDGSVIVGTPVFEQGTGSHTILQQIVAEELALPPERVRVTVLDTDQTPFDSGLGASRVTRIASEAAFQAVKEAKQELLGLAAELLDWPEEMMAIVGDEVTVPGTGKRQGWGELLARVGRTITKQAINHDTGRSPVIGFTAQVAEVSVDPETGKVKLLRFTSAHDVGRVLNPVGHQGQINGGVIQGMGHALMEELPVEEGRVSVANFGDYKIPTLLDVPEFKTVLVESEIGVGPYQIKGIGELANVPVAAAIANAVEDALGVRIRDLPITAEKVLWELRRDKHPART
ncbi:MAG: xanthine dehydrogenase family protein molybdopterin-binding subunit, partial [Chloroflexi bacterium]|nr:xanthine dehydrogenase family protein molybdopterin-binding subunit [Chloroflexota bacterium]